jgi:hypothetical protein
VDQLRQADLPFLIANWKFDWHLGIATQGLTAFDGHWSVGFLRASGTHGEAWLAAAEGRKR